MHDQMVCVATGSCQPIVRRKIVKKILKWMGFVVAGLIGIALLGFAGIYLASQRELGHEYVVNDAIRLSIPTEAAEIAEGRRLAQVTGCLHCHGDRFGGQMLHDFPNLVRFVAPNVSGVMKDYSDTQLDAVIRHGVKSDGTGVLFMPSEMFRHLRDADVARIIAYLRTVEPAEGTREKTVIRPLGRLLIAKGDFKSAARAIETLPPPVDGFDANDPVSHGRYLTMNLCTECHAQDLEGMPIAHSPPLSVAKGYSAGQFARLMRQGMGTGEREFPLMTPTSRARFAHLHDEEIAAIYAFLQSRP
jgi:cytochrome c553